MNFAWNKLLPKSRAARFLWGMSLLLSALLLVLPAVFKLDGKVHADWQQFLGRFHPLIVHLPIGLILLVPLLDIIGIVRPALREAAGFVLALCVPATLAALVAGYMLAYGSGDAGAGVSRHMWGGISLTIAVLFCALIRPAWASGAVQGISRLGYPAVLTGVLGLLSWTAHQGGSLTHGENYLTQYLPPSLKHTIGVEGSQSTSGPLANSFYAKQIHPVLDKNCVSCHGESSVKGGLRLDSYEALMKGGEEGPAVIAGQPDKSLLLQRVTLPVEHKKFMPSEGKPPLKAEEIALLKAWIAQGASGSAISLSGVDVHEEDAPPPPVGNYSALVAEIEHTAKVAGVTVVPVSRNPADGLILNTVNTPGTFGDAQLASFQRFAPYIVEVSLARTIVTDASFDTLAKFTQLRALHLEDTAVTGSGLQKLAPLSQLKYLNLSGTKVSQAAIVPLNSMKQLRHVYLYNTPAHPDTGAPGILPDTPKTSEPGKETAKARQAI